MICFITYWNVIVWNCVIIIIGIIIIIINVVFFPFCPFQQSWRCGQRSPLPFPCFSFRLIICFVLFDGIFLYFCFEGVVVRATLDIAELQLVCFHGPGPVCTHWQTQDSWVKEIKLAKWAQLKPLGLKRPVSLLSLLGLEPQRQTPLQVGVPPSRSKWPHRAVHYG